MNMINRMDDAVFDVVVIGGGPSGATAANDLAKRGLKVALLDRAGRIKPCGGAIPPRAMLDFDIPESQLVAHSSLARMIAPSGKKVDMPVGNGYVGMVDREHFDEWLRVRASESGAKRVTGTYERISRDAQGTIVHFFEGKTRDTSNPQTLRTRLVIGADGAKSNVAKQEIKGGDKMTCVFAYHEIIEKPVDQMAEYDPNRCDVYYQGKSSPDFYAWIFPHGETMSIGTGSMKKGFALRESIAELRTRTGLDKVRTIRREGAPIPLKPLKKWDNGRDVIVCGDAAGVVAPASGEGIYYAMACGRMAADSAAVVIATGDAGYLKQARKTFMKEHGKVFLILGIMQYFWYSSDRRRESFVKMCQDPDVQRLTWESYMHKRLVKREKFAQLKIFFKDTAHLLGFAKA
jgi:geranylgeranyl reductase